MKTVWPEIFIVESIAIVIGNLLTIAVLCNKRFLKKRGNWLIINLAVADLLVGAVSEPLYIATLKGSSSSIYRAYTPLDILLGMASVFGLTSLALDRLFAILWPFRHRTVSNRAYVSSIVIIWVTAATIAILSSLVLTNRMVVFFYILLPLLTISQILMIFSYVAIWIFATSKRPRCASSSASSFSDKGVPCHPSQHNGAVDELTGSVRNLCVDFIYDHTSKQEKYNEETGSVRYIYDFDICPPHQESLRLEQKHSIEATTLGTFPGSLLSSSTATIETESERKRKSLREVKTSLRHPRRESFDRDHRLALTLFMVTAISLLAWLPFEVMNIILSLCKSCRVKLYNIHVLSLTKLLHYANSLVNPIIYTFRIREFRGAINTVLTVRFLRKRSPTLSSTFTGHNATYSLRYSKSGTKKEQTKPSSEFLDSGNSVV